VSQFQTLQFSMTLDRWWRERERDQLYAGADGGLRPLPLGRGSAWRPPTTSYWVVMWENARPCAGRSVFVSQLGETGSWESKRHRGTQLGIGTQSKRYPHGLKYGSQKLPAFLSDASSAYHSPKTTRGENSRYRRRGVDSSLPLFTLSSARFNADSMPPPTADWRHRPIGATAQRRLAPPPSADWRHWGGPMAPPGGPMAPFVAVSAG
jgi:hypothetical protein